MSKSQKDMNSHIRSEGYSLIDDGMTVKDASKILWNKYHKYYVNHRDFDNHIGASLRKYLRKKEYGVKQGRHSEHRGSKVIPMQTNFSDNQVPERVDIVEKSDGTAELHIEKPTCDFQSDEEEMQNEGIDPNKYEVVSRRVSKWQAQRAGGDIIEMSSRNITVRKKSEEVDFFAELKRRFDGKTFSTYRPPLRVVNSKDAECAIVSIADLHLGKFSEPEICGKKAFNTEKAIKAYWQIMNQAIEFLKTRSYVEKIYFYWSQDFFHYDTPAKTTTAGTQQDTDIGIQKLFDTGMALLIDGINELARIAPVVSFYTRSNHSEVAGAHAAVALKYIFRDNKYVHIDDGLSPRHYEQYGVNLFGFAHGDKEGTKIKGMMQYEAPQMWAGTHFREWFLGHFHSQKYLEEYGITFRYQQSPTGTDEWHTESGYVGALQAGQLYIRSKLYGPKLEMPLFVLSDQLDDTVKSSNPHPEDSVVKVS